MLFPFLRRIFPLAVVFVPIACVDLTGLDLAGHLTGIGVDHGAIVEVGDTVRLSARGSVSGVLGWLLYDRLLDAKWTISDPTIAQLELLPPPLPPPQDSSTPTRTLVRGRRPGIVTVKASARGLSGEAPVRVLPVVAKIQVGGRDTLAVGDTIFMTIAVLDAGGAAILGVPLTFDAGGSVKLVDHGDVSVRIVALTAGPGTVSVRFRAVVGVATIVVRSPAGSDGPP